MTKRKSKKVRIPSTTVEIILILGSIIREHLNLNLQGTECWTLELVSQFSREYYDDFSDELAIASETSTYLGNGYLHAYIEDGPVQKVETRVRCVHEEAYKYLSEDWAFELWLKYSDGRIMRYNFSCAYGNMGERELFNHKDKAIPPLPPRRIAFSEA